MMMSSSATAFYYTFPIAITLACIVLYFVHGFYLRRLSPKPKMKSSGGGLHHDNLKLHNWNIAAQGALAFVALALVGVLYVNTSRNKPPASPLFPSLEAYNFDGLTVGPPYFVYVGPDGSSAIASMRPIVIPPGFNRMKSLSDFFERDDALALGSNRDEGAL
mgnify:CR=1 FL=1